MKFHKKIYTRGAIALAMTASMRAVSFAGVSNNTINDVPSSPNENRTIQTSTTLYTSSCDISQELAFYT